MRGHVSTKHHSYSLSGPLDANDIFKVTGSKVKVVTRPINLSLTCRPCGVEAYLIYIFILVNMLETVFRGTVLRAMNTAEQIAFKRYSTSNGVRAS